MVTTLWPCTTRPWPPETSLSRRTGQFSLRPWPTGKNWKGRNLYSLSILDGIKILCIRSLDSTNRLRPCYHFKKGCAITEGFHLPHFQPDECYKYGYSDRHTRIWSRHTKCFKINQCITLRINPLRITNTKLISGRRMIFACDNCHCRKGHIFLLLNFIFKRLLLLFFLLESGTTAPLTTAQLTG